ncbi:MAG: isoprenylcysteine carboxylmethyltransferase family protein [Candidatus Dadabacteria bacterium]|nr:isoprenylcysteine carboxylmethyltransferase family protein [Candidatus Dadabacteria bacterium]NIS09572.1 isoprenylcysteine carboxylmethyltransferase family protein [Candidatus Dadabacteria bacterium]NIV43081.1 DUF1295 domain-containing protein [Candidatus Dadabacteria bacterium]NIX16046.1 DUF1295 domain-containing protein [Candidatus Dadabacteria bacterium]NIY22749.1 DUF1295 domain-containing protein [Candidatus Dadabacteria bacterium]
MTNEKPDNANVIVLPPVIYVGFFIVGYTLHYFIRLSLVQHHQLASILDITGAALIIVSLIFPVLAVKTLQKSKTTHMVSEPTTAIVSSGVFKYSRNPIYLSGITLYIGISLIINSLILITLVIPLFFVIRQGLVKREEDYLERKFGEQYLNYKKRVRRWI